MWHYYHSLMSRINHFDSQDWLLFGAVVVGIGLFCMKGFGSRSTYSVLDAPAAADSFTVDCGGVGLLRWPLATEPLRNARKPGSA